MRNDFPVGDELGHGTRYPLGCTHVGVTQRLDFAADFFYIAQSLQGKYTKRFRRRWLLHSLVIHVVLWVLL